MTIFQQVVTIGLCAVGTMFTRFLPFAVFSGKKPTPKYIEYLGKALPGAVFGMLVMYCLRNVNFTVQSYGIPELLSVAVTGGAARLEEKYVFVHCGGNGLLHGSC